LAHTDRRFESARRPQETEEGRIGAIPGYLSAWPSLAMVAHTWLTVTAARSLPTAMVRAGLVTFDDTGSDMLSAIPLGSPGRLAATG